MPEKPSSDNNIVEEKMSKIQKASVAAFVVVIMGMGIVSTFATDNKQAAPAAKGAPSAAAADNTIVDKGWTVRCPDKAKSTDKKNCEIFTRLEMKSSAMRVAEFAVGFPQDKTLPAGTARGAIILPLGILLQSGSSSISVDNGTPFAFSSRYCTAAGCFSSVNLDKEILGSMKKGKLLNIFFKTADGHDAHAVMDLSSFPKALSSIE
jgi:invasion protein IalB